MKEETYSILRELILDNYYYSAFCGITTLTKMEHHFHERLPERHKKDDCFPLEFDRYEENIYCMGFIDAMFYFYRMNQLDLDRKAIGDAKTDDIEMKLDEEDLAFLDRNTKSEKKIRAAIMDCITSYEHCEK